MTVKRAVAGLCFRIEEGLSLAETEYLSSLDFDLHVKATKLLARRLLDELYDAGAISRYLPLRDQLDVCPDEPSPRVVH